MNEHLLISLGSILVLGVGAQWLAWRLRLPSILLLLLFGFIAGPIAGLVDPDELFGRLLFPLVSVSVAIILFEGGLSLRLSEIPKVRGVIFRLITIGTIVTWAIIALAAYYILAMDLALSILLGAILVVTGPTVVGPLLQQIRPRGQAGVVLKWEGILIDPVGVMLAVLIFEAILSDDLYHAPLVVLNGVLLTLLIGVVLGVLSAGLMVALLRRHWIPDHLQNGFSLLLAVSAFVASDLLHPESGLLTVTVMGIFLANQKWVSIKHLIEFKESLRVLFIGSLFILLAARLKFEDITGFGWEGPLFMAVLVLLARPLATLVSTWRSELSGRERLFIAWMAPRGIVAASVASIFAFDLVAAGHVRAEQLKPVTFLVIVSSVALYGLTSGPLARKLGLSEQNPQGVFFVGAHLLARTLAAALQAQGFRVTLIDTNPANLKAAQNMGLPVYHQNALSEDMLDVELRGIGRLLAMTPNNEVNALAALHYSEIFGRSEVYQLTSGKGEVDNVGQQTLPQHLGGRFLFSKKATCTYLEKQFAAGAEIQTISLNKSFDYVAFQTQHNNKALPLFLVTANKKLVIYTTDYQPIPKSGQTLIALTPPVTASEQAR